MSYEHKLKNRAIQREAMKRTTRTLIKFSLFSSVIVGYGFAFHYYPEVMSDVTLLGMGAVLVYGFVMMIYHKHLSDVNNHDENTRY